MVFSWQSAASASSAWVSFFSIIAVLIWVRTDSRAALDTLAFMPGVPRLRYPTALTAIYRLFSPGGKREGAACFRFPDDCRA